MDQIGAQLGVAGSVVAVLIIGLRWMAAQYNDMKLQLQANAKACSDREVALAARLQSLEDSRNDSLNNIVQATMDALRISASALHENSGAFRSIIGSDTQTTALQRRDKNKGT